MAVEEPLEAICETRYEKMISQKDGEMTVRMATFLKPTARNANQAVAIPNTPLLSEVLSRDLQHWSSKVLFRGWKFSQTKWKELVDRLAQNYTPIWIQAGIYNAIMSSIYEVRCNQELVLGLSEYWCPETNTFVFPWGEATITLEDVMILGGYPVLGESVTSPSQAEELMEIEQELRKYRTEVQRGKSRKPHHSGWIKILTEEEKEYEHAVFLSLWLSRFLFPSFCEETIGKNVLPIAAKLSQGIKVALAPAVLASLYKDLSKLSEDAMAGSEKIILLAPFQLLQIWAFERFPPLAPKCPNSLQSGEPRVARWHKLKLKLNMLTVRSALELARNFQWRPYAADVKNWKHPSYYKETEQFVFDCSSIDDDDELMSFLKFLQVSELVGLDCKEKYLPHRVAMEFGMDQDLPGDLSRFDLTREFVNFYVPPRTFQPGVAARYCSWWKDWMVIREKAMKDILLKKRNLLTLVSQKNGITEHGFISTPIGSKYNSPSIAPEVPSKIRKQIVLEWSDDDEFQPVPSIHVNVSCAPAVASSHPKSSSKSSKDAKLEEGDEPITTSSEENKNESEDSSSCDDHLPISTHLCKPCYASSTSDHVAVATSSSRKRNSSSIKEGITSQKKANVHSDEGAAREVSGGGDQSTKTKGFPREVNIEADYNACHGDTSTGPDDENGLCKERGQPVKICTRKRDSRMAGNSRDNPEIID